MKVGDMVVLRPSVRLNLTESDTLCPKHNVPMEVHRITNVEGIECLILKEVEYAKGTQPAITKKAYSSNMFEVLGGDDYFDKLFG